MAHPLGATLSSMCDSGTLCTLSGAGSAGSRSETAGHRAIGLCGGYRTRGAPTWAVFARRAGDAAARDGCSPGSL